MWLFLLATLSLAHLDVTSHRTRTQAADLKEGPCGEAGVERGKKVYTYAAGEEILITWDEFIDHPGYFRISFDDDGTDDFQDPATPDERYGNPTVLLDQIKDKSGGNYSRKVTLPDVICDNCTIQVMQVMTDKAPFGDGNDLYYECIDVVLVAAPDTGAPKIDDTGGAATSGGCGCESGAPLPGGSLLLAGLLGISRRRAGARSARSAWDLAVPR